MYLPVVDDSCNARQAQAILSDLVSKGLCLKHLCCITGCWIQTIHQVVHAVDGLWMSGVGQTMLLHVSEPTHSLLISCTSTKINPKAQVFMPPQSKEPQWPPQQGSSSHGR